VVPAFARSADFAMDKPAGKPCPNLQPGFGCGIHDSLRERGFPGCVSYDCFGAGQQVAQGTFGGRDWRGEPELAEPMFAVFPIVRQLHELLWYLNEARALDAAAPVHAALDTAIGRVEGLAAADPDTLRALHLPTILGEANALLVRASSLARTGGIDLRGADLVGKRFRGTELRGASLRGAVLIGADLRGADLSLADVTGADLRGADLRGADLRTALFLTGTQLDSAKGDRTTRLPSWHTPRWH
jgi:uncharacterized protein YjbI with pentapeptide repeats